MKRIRSLDLFCGAGGSSFGAQRAGVEVVAGFDMWDAATTTFKTNFPNSRVFLADLRRYSSKNIKRIGDLIDDIDLLLASPECTNHSNAKGNKERSEESRETAFQVVRFAKRLRPRWIIIENVIEMKSWDRYSELLGEFTDLGYCVNEVTLNARDFGVPQSRERLFILCAKTSFPSAPPKSNRALVPASSIIASNEKYGWSPLFKNNRAENTLRAAERAITAVGNGTPFLLTYYGSGRNGNGGWQSLDEPLGTVTTLDRYALVRPSVNGHVMRMLQPEELKLAMGYDPGFRLESIPGLTRRTQIKLMGNGVCPPVMESVVRNLVRR